MSVSRSCRVPERGNPAKERNEGEKREDQYPNKDIAQ